MRKNYAYLLFALFFTFSACQEDGIESPSGMDVSENESTTFTYVYKGNKYLETRSSPEDPFQNEIIAKVLSTDTYAIHNDLNQKDKNTLFLFDSSKELIDFLGASSINARIDCNSGNQTGGHVANLVLYRDKNYEGSRGRSPGWIFGSGPSFLWTSYTIDNYPTTPDADGYPYLQYVGNRYYPCTLSLPSLGGMNNATSSLAFSHRPYASSTSSLDFRAAQQNHRAAVVLYNKENYGGVALSFTLRGYETDLVIPNMGVGYFYDFFGIKYGPSWNDKISSLYMVLY